MTTSAAQPASLSREETIKAIRKALKARSGKTWSVRGGTGTAWGWIRISSPPARSDAYGRMSPEETTELHELLGLKHYGGSQGVQVPDSSAHYREFIDRAEGRTPSVIGQQYWD
jgi:hypothetical protein